MREDFNKLLTERERLGHKRKFGDHRNAKLNKVLDEDMSGGKESIHARRRHAKGGNGDRKSFNENLNPLKNYLRTNVGRPWDKIYSEITSAFDKRKVVNNHILEHLFQYVELDVYIIDGKPFTLNRYASRNGREEYDPITYGSDHYPTYYVDPRDGILKRPKAGKTRRQREAESAAALEKEQAKVYRRIDEDNHLCLIDGVWFHYMAKERPPKVMKYTRPYFGMDDAAAVAFEERLLAATTEAEKNRLMIGKLVDAPMRDEIEPPAVRGFTSYNYYRGTTTTMIPDNKYFYRRQAASHKQLKAAGIDGLEAKTEVPNMSHREASKYRPKKAGK